MVLSSIVRVNLVPCSFDAFCSFGEGESKESPNSLALWVRSGFSPDKQELIELEALFGNMSYEANKYNVSVEEIME